MRLLPVALALLTATAVFSDIRPAHADQALAKRHIKQAGLIPLKGCQDLSTPQALEARTKAWISAIEAMRAERPAYVQGWLVGAEPPPREVIEETRYQLQCMLSQMVEAAADPKDPLRLDHLSHRDAPTKAEMAKLAALYRQQAATRSQLLRRVLASHYRDAASQSIIWHRKHNFYGNSFNLISADAAKRCGLPAGQTWKPSAASHRACWIKTLSQPDREKEILNASSAPGISRHHWGTDIDIFGLNPRKFQKGQPLHDEYVWMTKHAHNTGFFQPFTGHDRLGQYTYIEERWHWSYAPISQAMLAVIQAQPTEFERALGALWDSYERRWGGKNKPAPYFSYIRKHWRDYVFNVAPLRAQALALPKDKAHAAQR